MDQLLQVCSALTVNHPICQPKFAMTEWARNDEKAPIMFVCAPCAHTCFGFQNQRNRSSTSTSSNNNNGGDHQNSCIDILDTSQHMRELKQPFVCQCSNIKMTGHKCLFAEAAAEDKQQGQDKNNNDQGGVAAWLSSVFATRTSTQQQQQQQQQQQVQDENNDRDASSSSSSKQTRPLLSVQDMSDLAEAAWRRECKAFLEDVSYHSDVDNAVGRDNAKEIETLTKKLRQQQDLFEQYFEEDAQAAARRVMPMNKLVSRARTAYRNELETAKLDHHRAGINNNNDVDDVDVDVENIQPHDPRLHDHILKQLLHWFKNDFFTWVDQPNCPKCDTKTVPTRTRPPGGAVVPTPEEKQNLANTVELYDCPNCGNDNAHVRFPRYNKATRLLTWRKGRCGEWANCFALLCIALGFETRFVLDLTDHVWVETFSIAKNRWINSDPCENAFDAPLMYEKGWGKKLNYIFAISREEVVDVIRRYSEHPNELETRTRVSEVSLSHLVGGMNWYASRRVPEAKVALYEQRVAAERAELSHHGGSMIQGEDQSGATSRGRQSGSKSWTRSRSEAGGGGGGGSGGGIITASSSQQQQQLTTLDSISVDAGALAFQSRVGGYDQRFVSAPLCFIEEATVLDDNDNKGEETKKKQHTANKMKWLWKGGKKNIRLLSSSDTENNNNTVISFNETPMFFFAPGSPPCQLILQTSSSSSSATSSISGASSSPPPPTSSTSLSTSSGGSSPAFKYPSRDLVVAPRLPVPLQPERFTSVVDELNVSLWCCPSFCLPASHNSNNSNRNFKGIVGFSVGNTFRVDLSWEFKETKRGGGEEEEEGNRKSRFREGELRVALSLRHIDLPSLADWAQIAKKTKWSENFSSVTPVGIWDSKSKAKTSSSCSNNVNIVPSCRFVETRISSDVENTCCYALPVPLQLFASLDRQGALTALAYHHNSSHDDDGDRQLKGQTKETVNHSSSSSSFAGVTCLANVGSIVPLYLCDRGVVSVKAHGIDTMVEAVNVAW